MIDYSYKIKLSNKLSKSEQKKFVDAALEDIQAFNKLYEAYVDKIYNFLYFKVYNEDVATDLTGDVFLKAIDAFTNGNYKWDENAGFNGWIYRLAHNTCVDYFKKASTRKEHNLNDEIQHEDDFDMSKIENKLDLEQISSKIHELSKDFDDQTQTILVLKHREEHTFEEIADTLEANISTVKMKYYRCLKFLKSELAELSNV